MMGNVRNMGMNIKTWHEGELCDDGLDWRGGYTNLHR